MLELVRRRFDHMLRDRASEVVELGTRSEYALQQIMRSWRTGSHAIIEQVVNSEAELREARVNLEQNLITLFATQQPIVGRDLRFFWVSSAVASELERTGHYAARIAAYTVQAWHCDPPLAPLPSLVTMTEHAQQLLHTATVAYQEQDVEQARSLRGADVTIEAMRLQLLAELKHLAHNDIAYLEAVQAYIEMGLLLKMTVDRVLDIGSRVIYLKTCNIEVLRQG